MNPLSQVRLTVEIPKKLRAVFRKAVVERGTTMSFELRKFIENYGKKNG